MVNPPPLDTSVISLLCYYDHGSPITLADTLLAFQTYIQYDNYIDGTVRVWSATNLGPTSSRSGDGTSCSYPKGDDSFDVHIRVRTDGWILAWMLRTEDYGEVVWWGQLPDNGATTNPTAYSTRLSRAIKIILDQAGIAGGWSYETSVDYFDYEYVTATKLYMFGKIYNTGYVESPLELHSYVYHTVPPGITVRRARASWSRYHASNATSRQYYIWLYYDSNILLYASHSGASCYWYYTRAYDVLAYMTTGVQHYTDVKITWNSGGNGIWFNFRHNLIVVTD